MSENSPEVESPGISAEAAELRRLREAISGLGLDSRGCVQVLRRRLRQHNRPPAEQAYRHLLVVDFEATCERLNPDGYQHEIIEFPLVLLDLASGHVVGRWHAYCRPRLRPRLSDFCRELTGISQAAVNSAPVFPVALAAAQAWLERSGALASPLALAADCHADVATFLRIQCGLDGIPVPAWARAWVNLRVTFQRYYGLPARPNLAAMLAALGLEFQGRPHSGRDDAENVARVAAGLTADGCRLMVNQRLDPARPPAHWRPIDKAEAEAELRRTNCSRRRRSKKHRRQADEEDQDVDDSLPSGETVESLSDLVYLMQLRDRGGSTS